MELALILMIVAAGCARSDVGQPPQIDLRFIGVVDPGAGKPKTAVLLDGSGPPMYGKEGEIVQERYRILKIGEESLELAHTDGRGKVTIRLTGEPRALSSSTP
jgi:hypothetical protein